MFPSTKNAPAARVCSLGEPPPPPPGALDAPPPGLLPVDAGPASGLLPPPPAPPVAVSAGEDAVSFAKSFNCASAEFCTQWESRARGRRGSSVGESVVERQIKARPQTLSVKSQSL